MIQWVEFNQLANDLRQTQKEAHLRSAISRAYYAAFNEARDYAEVFQSFQSDSHAAVRELYRLNGHISVSKHLSKMRPWRNNSDYRNIFDKKNNNLFELINKANQCLMSSNAVLQTIQDAKNKTTPIVFSSQIHKAKNTNTGNWEYQIIP